ncbi:serine/threonine protein kinase [Nonomuraea sp. KC401]|uniref:serine/threonine-protein kinase n=1 Tax=unclassified Nonomuraea TaxID=2593643 RepID=UPI0010FD2AE3|nr:MULTISPECIES: serine/threonine-protein kinase [unclassified Nonomuraea]NBE97413.1 protein kinase [Nonomuraea sp. K271]TLF64865.1 serine/threonine protein kinase [Nonomuraea sp. KC401]
MSELRADDPRRLGPYRLTRRLGQGGQGVVYLGESPQGGKVAIKLLRASLSGDPDVRRRFLGEVEAVRRVAAFCTAQLIEADLEGDRPYLVSEYVEGPSLREHVIAEGPRQGGSLDRLAIGTATALGAIHRAGVVHRDFKPGNVLLGIDGPRVIDFGVSRLVNTTATTGHIPVGTPAYMAPERIHGEPAGPPADLWAWGLTVAYTASGRHAFTAETHREVLARVLYGKPDLGPLRGALREIVQACLAPEPGDRPSAEEALLRLLGQQAAGEQDVLTSGAMAAVGVAGQDVLRSGAMAAVGVAGQDEIVITDPDPTTSFPVVRVHETAGASARRDTAGQVGASGRMGSQTGGTAPGGADLAGREADGEVRAPGAPPRRMRLWQVVVALAGLAMGVAGFVFWLRGAEGSGLEGTWTGSAEHPTAKRVFPVELRVREDGVGAMRWGADLHCSGRIGETGSRLVFTLDRVEGKECHPGTLRLLPTGDTNQMAIKVTRHGEDEVTYSGKVARTS